MLPRMDIETAALTVTDPNSPLGDPLMKDGEPITVTIYSPTSGVMRRFDEEQQDNMARRASKSMKLKLEGENLRALAEKRTMASIADWSSNLRITDDDFPCTEGNKLVIATDPAYDWLRSQIDEFAGEAANFISRAET